MMQKQRESHRGVLAMDCSEEQVNDTLPLVTTALLRCTGLCLASDLHFPEKAPVFTRRITLHPHFQKAKIPGIHCSAMDTGDSLWSG